MPEKNTNKPIIIWLLTGCVLVFAMVVIGGTTRLTHSGLSMVEWNLFIGSLPPMNDGDWQVLFDQYRQFPEFKELNYDFRLNDFKAIFWWEYIHRLLGRLIGVVFLLPFFWFLLREKLDKPFIKKLLIILALGAFQGLLGWFMVKSGLVKEPRVSHYRLAAHLITAFLTAAYIFWVTLDLLYKESKPRHQPVLRKWAVFLLSVLLLQIVYGAFVAGLRAGTVHTTFPLMDGQFLPDAATSMKPLWANFTEGRAGVQFVHRCLAYFAVGIVAIIWWKGKRAGLDKAQRFAINGLAIAVVVQFTLGVLTLLNSTPVFLALLHQAGAFVLLLFTVLLLHRTRNSLDNEFSR